MKTIDKREEVLRNAAPALLAALERIAAAGGPFDDSHDKYWAINADDMAAVLAAIEQATTVIEQVTFTFD